MCISGSTLNTIRTVDQATAESQKFVMTDQSAVSMHAESFKLKTRTSVGDKAKLNSKADVSIAHDRSSGWQSCNYDCEMHISSTI